MSQSSTNKDGQQTVTIARAERGRFAPGHAGGPGRPPRGQSLAEQYRRETDWQAMRAVLETIALNAKAKDVDRISAVRELTDRAWGKPSNDLHITAHQGEEARSLAHITDDRIRELLAEIDGDPALPEQTDG